MKPLAAFAALAVAVAAAVTPALARTSYVIDDAHLLSSAAIAQINTQVGDFNAQTGKEVVVVTTPSLDGVAPDAALERSFAQQQVNGVEIFIAKDEKQIRIGGDVASRRFFPNGSFGTIYQAMKPSFAAGNFDTGVETGVSLILNTYRGHESSLNHNRAPVYVPSGAVYRSSSGGGMGWIWWIIILALIFFVIRGIFRAITGPRMMPPGYGPGMPGGMPPMGYGGGYGYGGGGGGFWSGLLGGLGGAWLGNELFNNNRNFGGDGGGYYGGDMSGGGNAGDASGWQSDAGQIDTSGVGGGGWGDSSGGGWGGGDSGGGGFGDGGGGGGGDGGGGGW
jgi:hypothetical protein